MGFGIWALGFGPERLSLPLRDHHGREAVPQHVDRRPRHVHVDDVKLLHPLVEVLEKAVELDRLERLRQIRREPEGAPSTNGSKGPAAAKRKASPFWRECILGKKKADGKRR